jgi:hypothetical protein
MAFTQKLFTSYHGYSDGDTRIGERNRIWYDSNTNTFRIQLDDTPGGTAIGGSGGGGTYTLPTATGSILGGVKIGANVTITNGVISVAAPFSGSYNDLSNKPTLVTSYNSLTDLPTLVTSYNSLTDLPDLTGYATLTGEETLTNKTLTSPTITDGVFQHTFTIGNQIFYEHGYNGFSVNEDFDIVGENNFTGYHYTSGAGRDGVAFTLARTGQFTTGFGIHGTADSNEYVIGSETTNTDFVFKNNIGMPFNVSGGTEIFRISKTGVLTTGSGESLETIATESYVTTQGYITSTDAKALVNGPAFRAYVDTAQAITSGSQQKVTFGSKTFDTNTNFASSRFTPTVEGYFQLNATVRIDGTASTGEYMIILYKNGSEYARGTNAQGTEAGANFYAMQVSDIAYANGSTDYFEVYIQQTSSANRNTTAGSTISHFSGCMIRGA